MVGCRAVLKQESRSTSPLLPCSVYMCESSRERRAGAWVFRNHCICIRLRQHAIA